MKYIISIRLKSDDSSKREQFRRGSEGTVQTKIINMINSNPYGNFDFLVNEDGNKYIQTMEDLQGEVVNIVDDNCIAEFTEDEDGSPIILLSQNEGALPQQHNIDQWKALRKMTKGVDIGDRISDMNKQGSNIQYIHNAIDTGIESSQDYDRSKKKFVPNWNLKRLKPFKTYFLDQSTSDRPSRKKRGKKS